MGTSHLPARLFGIRICWWLWFVCLTGLGVRVWLVDLFYPMTGGDPLYSYTYRATLIAAGQWEGVFLMWHPPGYPLLLGGLSAATGGFLRPYWAGVAVSLASYVGLFWVIDRLVAPRVRYSGTRIVVGSFIALYETLFLWAAGPLTEPVYLLLVYGAVLALDCGRLRSSRVLVAGLLIGLGFTIRLEAAAPAVGLATYCAACGWRVGRWAGVAAFATVFVAGWAATAGWLAVNVDYLRVCAAAQRWSYTIPPASGPAGIAARVAESAYHAVTVWLPFALLLPYWVIAGAGLTHRTAAPGRRLLHPLLLAVVLPSLVAVGWTIMHKRTASFLLPAAAVWFGFGMEVLARRWAGRRPLVIGTILGLAVAANGVQAIRIAFFVRKEMPSREVPDSVAASALLEAGATAGAVWAFGSEPDVYALCGWPVVYPFFTRDEGYNQAYTDHAGNPTAFVEELRRRDFRYLIFMLTPRGGDRIEKQPFTGHGPAPLRDDLEQIAANPGQFGLDDLGSRQANRGGVRVHVYRIR